MTRIGFLAHDLADAAVHRRVTMLRQAGADVVVAGLMRGKADPPAVAGKLPLVLGRSEDARLVRRIPKIARITLLDVGRIARHFGRVDAVVARNLEMLTIGRQFVSQQSPRPRLIYECLDIHRLLTAPGPAGQMLRALEKRLGFSVDVVITSSPAFVENHLGKHALFDRILLAENKVLISDETPDPAAPTAPGPPWKIGWFGALRCRRSFEILAALAEQAEGKIEIVIRGRPSPAVFPDLAREVLGHPHLRFDGPYRNPEDLATIYGDVHFSWCIDFYEEGANSAWLLPNRLYEGGFHNTVPIALRAVETGRFMSRNGFGLLLDDPVPHQLEALFAKTTPARYRHEVERMVAQPRSLWQADGTECAALLEAIAGPTTHEHEGRALA